MPYALQAPLTRVSDETGRDLLKLLLLGVELGLGLARVPVPQPPKPSARCRCVRMRLLAHMPAASKAAASTHSHSKQHVQIHIADPRAGPTDAGRPAGGPVMPVASSSAKAYSLTPQRTPAPQWQRPPAG
jgi:hypothetical protein